ncbi:MAG: tape measure protein [Candidatus Contendobacter sp.]|nr:tape measure protein [Candidatus Contendobacter sp.]
MADRNLELALRIRAAVQGAGSIDDLRRDLGGLADEIEQAANPTDDFNRGLRDLGEAGQKAGQGVKKAADPLGEFKDLIGGIAIAGLVKQILDLNDQGAALQRGFNVITGSAKATGEALDFVRGVADRLGVSHLDLAQSFLKITAAAKGTQLEGAATEKIFASLVGAMSTVGGSAQDVDNAMTAMAQIMSKGVVSAEELRGQLGDVLPGAAKIAAESLLVTNAEFSKMLESGSIVAEEFLPKFAAQLEKSLGGGQGQVESFGASWNRLLNQLTTLATGPVGKGLTDFASLLADKLGVAVRASGAVSDAIGAVGKAIGGLAAGEFGAAWDDLSQSVGDAGAKLFGFQTQAQAAAEREKQMLAELRALTPEIDRFQTAVDRKELKNLPASLQTAVGMIRQTGDVAAATTQAISDFLASANKNLNFDGVIKLAGALKLVRTEGEQAAVGIQNTLAAALEKLSDEQLERLKRQATAAMAAASQGSETARKAFADLGLVVDAVTNVQLKRAAEESGNVAVATRQLAADIEGLAKAQADGLRAELALAQARGDSVEVSRLSVALAEQEARSTREAVAVKQQAIDAEKAATAAKLAQLQAIKTNSDAEEQAKKIQIAALEARQKTLDVQRQSIQVQAEETAAVAKLEATTQKLIAAGYDEAEAKKLALLASGQFTEALKIEEQQRQRNAQAAASEVAASEDAAAAKEREAAASAQAAQERSAAAHQAEQEAVRVAEKVVYAAQSFDQLNEKGRAALQAIATGYDTAHGSIEQLNRAILEETQALDGAAAAEIAAAKRLERLQEIAAGVGPAAEQAKAALADMAAGASGMTAITQAGERVISTLKGIQQQANSARESLRAMSESFEEETLRIQGNQLELEERAHKARLERLAELRRIGGIQSEAEYQAAVQRANELHRIKLAQLREEEAARGRSGGGSSGGGSSGGSSGGAGTGTSSGRGGSGVASGGGGANVTNINIHVDGRDLLSEEQIRKKIIPALTRTTRLRK